MTSFRWPRLDLVSLEERALLTTYYIDAINGSDTNSGSVNQPWKTYQNIVSQVIRSRLGSLPNT